MQKRAAAFALVVLLVAPSSRAEPTIDVRAGRAEADLRMERVELSQGVAIEAGRARLDAERLVVDRRANGSIDVIGPARLRLCPSPDPPIDFGFDRATLAPDGDATLRGVRVRLLGETVLPVPWLALRPADHVGLLPPTVAWRGEDGLLLGVGAHVPLGDRTGLDVAPAAYLAGGHEIVAKLHDPTGDARVRWDHRTSDLVAVDGRGATGPDEAVVAWDVDAVRGARGRRATIALEDASQLYDRGAVGVVSAAQAGILGAELRGVAPRAAPGIGVGPRVVLSRGAVLGSGALVNASLDGGSLVFGDRDVLHAARADVDAASTSWTGPLRFTIDGRAGASVVATEIESATDGFALVRASMGAPLARTWGAALHTIEPRVGALVLAASSHGERGDPLGRPIAASSGTSGLATTGVASAWGEPGGGAVRLETAGGTLVSAARPSAVARGLVAADLAFVRARADVGATWTGSDAAGLAGGAALEVGPTRGPSLGAGIDGRGGLDPFAARAIVRPDAPYGGGWLASEGWSLRADAEVPLSSAWSSSATAFFDASARVLLGERASLAYRDRCGCLAAALHLARRIGRDGFDAFATVDLAP